MRVFYDLMTLGNPQSRIVLETINNQYYGQNVHYGRIKIVVVFVTMDYSFVYLYYLRISESLTEIDLVIHIALYEPAKALPCQSNSDEQAQPIKH